MLSSGSCILLKFYIKPQPITPPLFGILGCILLKFYIKPQLTFPDPYVRRRCILLKFYIKPQRRDSYVLNM